MYRYLAPFSWAGVFGGGWATAEQSRVEGPDWRGFKKTHARTVYPDEESEQRERERENETAR